MSDYLVKAVVCVQARPHLDRRHFQQWLLKQSSQQVFVGDAGLRKAVLNLVDVVPDHVAWRPPMEPLEVSDSPPYDAVFETWADSRAKLDIRFTPEVLAATTAVTAFRVSEFIEKNAQPARLGERSPGAKYIALCEFFDDLPDSAAKRSWSNHLKLALRVHAAMSKYVRNWIEEPLTPDAPKIRGIVELHFPTLEDIERRWFCSEAGQREIIQDVGHFLAKGNRMFASEYVLK